MTKTESEYRHAVKRAAERYACFVDPHWLVRSVRRLIRGGDSFPVHTASKRKTHHVVVLAGCVVLAVYDKQRKQVVTLLPSHNVWSYPLHWLRRIELNEYVEGAYWYGV